MKQSLMRNTKRELCIMVLECERKELNRVFEFWDTDKANKYDMNTRITRKAEITDELNDINLYIQTLKDRV